MHDTGAEAIYRIWIGIGTSAIEALAVTVIVGYILIATLNWLAHALARRRFAIEHYRSFRSTLGRAMLLGLEILVAADVVRTVVLEPTLRNYAALGLLVVIRTFLSWSTVLEIEGRWPWRSRASEGSKASE
jgi:uncharacterized membrane protein